MSVYCADEKGVTALNNSASQVSDAGNRLMSLVDGIERAASDNPDSLGPHAASFASAVEKLRKSIRGSTNASEEVAASLRNLAKKYQELIDNDPFGPDTGDDFAVVGGAAASAIAGGISTGAAINDSAQGSKDSSFFGRLFGGGLKSNSGGTKFGSFETGKYKNGDIVVKGDNFEQYISDYYDSDNSTYISISDKPIIETISPSSIEGIHLGTTEAIDPACFWRQHESDGTADSFKEIASHIPEVKAQLESGRSLSDLQEDPVLGRCAEIYFNPSNMPRVVKNNGYYEFDSNGRHRILAARELGYDIPVKVIGIRTRK